MCVCVCVCVAASLLFLECVLRRVMMFESLLLFRIVLIVIILLNYHDAPSVIKPNTHYAVTQIKSVCVFPGTSCVCVCVCVCVCAYTHTHTTTGVSMTSE